MKEKKMKKMIEKLFIVLVLSVLVLCSPVYADDSAGAPGGAATFNDLDMHGKKIINADSIMGTTVNATTVSSNLVIGNRLQSAGAPVAGQDLTNKAYVDAKIVAAISANTSGLTSIPGTVQYTGHKDDRRVDLLCPSGYAPLLTEQRAEILVYDYVLRRWGTCVKLTTAWAPLDIYLNPGY